MRFIIFSLSALMTCAIASADQKTIGRITATFGESTIERFGRSHAADLYSPIISDDCVKTQDAGISVLLLTRTVVKLDAATCLRISEGVGQTNVVLEMGTVQVFAGKRAADMGTVGVADDLAHIEGTDAVFLASYDRAKRSAYYACEHGTVTLEVTKSKQKISLDADQQVSLENEDAKVQPLDRATYNQHKRTLDRLGESIVKQGSEMQRTRTRALDTQTALNQLAAAGWIDRQMLIHPAAAVASQATSGSETSSNSSGNTTTPLSTSNDPVVVAPSSNDTSSSSSNDPPPNTDRDTTPRAKPDKPDKSAIDLPDIKLPRPDKVAREHDDFKFTDVKPQKDDHADKPDDIKIDDITKRMRDNIEKQDHHGPKHERD
jgi:hypothetical protein